MESGAQYRPPPPSGEIVEGMRAAHFERAFPLHSFGPSAGIQLYQSYPCQLIGPMAPIWAQLGPNGPIWDQMGPSWTIGPRNGESCQDLQIPSTSQEYTVVEQLRAVLDMYSPPSGEIVGGMRAAYCLYVLVSVLVGAVLVQAH